MENFGRLLILIGAIFLVSGLLFLYTPFFHWMGKLPGDIKWERGNVKVYFPIVSSILLSIALSLILSFFKKF